MRISEPIAPVTHPIMSDRIQYFKRERSLLYNNQCAPGSRRRHNTVFGAVLLLYFRSVSCFRCWNVPQRSIIRRPPAASSWTLHSSATNTPSATTTATASSFDDIDTSKIGDWEELHGNYLLRPSLNSGPPRALIHFLGGALLGAAPHVSYRYLLERLAAQGYLIVATPYCLSFDHLATCDAVISNFERIAGVLARTYGALPVVGVGHSCGALLQTLITSLFPDTPRAANALLSFNNKPVSEAVPLFEEVFVPLFTRAESEILTVSLQLAQATAVGQIPSDALLSQASKLLVPELLQNSIPADVTVPQPIRNAARTFLGPPTTALTTAGVVPVVSQALKALEQIPALMDEVAAGVREFCPAPDETASATRRAYRARRTLLVQYQDDPLDESDELQELLRAAAKVAAMKRPDVEIQVKRSNLKGGHAAPLLAPPLELATRAEDLLGVPEAKENLHYAAADATVAELVRWLEESNL